MNKDFTNVDLQNIFKPFGYLVQCGIHWDRLGNSKGTASIEYENIGSCRRAIRALDGKVIGGINLRVRFVKKTAVQFRKNGLRLGKRRQQQGNGKTRGRY